MKKLMAGIIVFTVSITLAWSRAPKSSTPVKCVTPADSSKGGYRTWILLITPQTKKIYLDSVITAWSKDNIVLNFSKLKNNSEGKLVKIKGSVDIMARGEHASGAFSSDNLESYEIKMDNGPGVFLSGK